MSIFLTALLVMVLVALSGFFSLAETALTSASRAKMLTLAQEGNWRAKVVNFLLAKNDKMLAALLLGNNLINILASAITTELMLRLFDKNGIAIATVLMTVIVLIFAEVLPKSWALHRADNLAMAIAPAVRIILYVLNPITSALSWIVRKTAALFGANFEQVKYSISIEELRGAIEMHQGDHHTVDQEETETIRHERAMMKSVLDLADVTVSEVMTHRRNAEMLDASLSPTEVIDRSLASQFSRLPIYQDNPENIVGVIHTKLLMRQLRAMEGSREEVDILSLVSEPWFIPETTTLFDQLQQFRERREHFALVVDEYGTWLGIVTLEDILEEIVGQIDDEHDHVKQHVHDDPQGDGSYVIDGTTTIRDINRRFDWNLPDEDYATVAGLVLYESQAVPDIGQSFTFYNYRFDILERHRHQITKVRVTPLGD